MKILFVCLGNICRSPTAAAVLEKLAAEGGRAEEISVDSAGTGPWHVGRPRDPRAVAAGAERGYRLSGKGRQVRERDFEDFDLILAMDRFNRSELAGIAPGKAAAAKVRLLREFDPASAGAVDLDVPDPYSGGARGFTEALDLIEAACRGLLAELPRREPAA